MDVVRLVFLLLHLVALPIAIIAALVSGLTPIAVVDLIAFLMLFSVELMFARKPARKAQPQPSPVAARSAA